MNTTIVSENDSLKTQVAREEEMVAYVWLEQMFATKCEHLSEKELDILADLNQFDTDYIETPVEEFVPTFSHEEEVRINKLGMVEVYGLYVVVERSVNIDNFEARIEGSGEKRTKISLQMAINKYGVRKEEVILVKKGWYPYVFKAVLGRTEYRRVHFGEIDFAVHVEMFKTFMLTYTKKIVINGKVKNIIVDHMDSGVSSRYNNQLTCLRQMTTAMNSLNSTKKNSIRYDEINFINCVELLDGLWFDTVAQLFISHNRFNYYIHHQYTLEEQFATATIMNGKTVKLKTDWVVNGKPFIIKTDLKKSVAHKTKLLESKNEFKMIKIEQRQKIMSDADFSFYVEKYNGATIEEFIANLSNLNIHLKKEMIIKDFYHLVRHTSDSQKRIYRKLLNSKMVTFICIPIPKSK